MKTAPRSISLVLDFDGTVTVDDVFDSMFARFAGPEWLEIDQAYLRGELPLEEAYLKMAATFRGESGAVVEFVLERMRPRAGWKELLAYADRSGIRARIVSNGFDLYIFPLLEAWGTPIPVLSHHAEIRGGRFEVAFNRHPRLADGRCLVGKAEIVRELQARGNLVVFAGDGLSDSGAAAAADLVFARRTLAGFCRREGIPHLPFDDFFAVIEGLEG
ncbi:MAG TPA: HAD-IB family phosphatase, partial [bacterium]|nr:HAD-IB family phosphatase [bacterium]